MFNQPSANRFNMKHKPIIANRNPQRFPQRMPRPAFNPMRGTAATPQTMPQDNMPIDISTMLNQFGTQLGGNTPQKNKIGYSQRIQQLMGGRF